MRPDFGQEAELLYDSYNLAFKYQISIFYYYYFFAFINQVFFTDRDFLKKSIRP